jgi:hypothetical protein
MPTPFKIPHNELGRIQRAALDHRQRPKGGNQQGSLDVWFNPSMRWLLAPCGQPGRPMRFSDRAIELCLTLKGLFHLPLRQATGMVASLLKMAGLDWPVPDIRHCSGIKRRHR